ncbi:MAG: GNAT family N-acetyltransferase [Cyanobacteria bacterium P01_G01_bin.54]
MPFSLHRPGYTVKPLFVEDAPIIQALYVDCTAFFELTHGLPPEPELAQKEFAVVPEGKTTGDRFSLGLFNDQSHLVGLIEAMRHYPKLQTWWIGLFLIHPDHRKRRLGRSFYQAFEQWIFDQGAQQVALVVIAANTVGFQFWQKLGFAVIEQRSSQSYGRRKHCVWVMGRAIA